jgi:catechol 2,3-dioxygenase-like lactoylglutathione lyase family enzyme
VADLAGIGHVHLIVADQARSARFDSEAFGLEEHFRVRNRLVFMGTDAATLIVLDAERTADGRAASTTSACPWPPARAWTPRSRTSSAPAAVSCSAVSTRPACRSPT